MGPKTERRHHQGDESRRRILDAAAEIAAERGYEGTTVSLVSKRSGLPVSSIYWHFGNKDDLIAAVIRRSYDAWCAELAPPEALGMLDRLDAREQLVAVIRHEAGSLARHPDFLRFGLMLLLERREQEPAARRLFLDVREESLQRIRDGYRYFLDHHGITADKTFVASLAELTMAAVDGIFLSAEVSPRRDVTPLLDMLAAAVDLLLAAQRS